jgi:hypothetical protein
MRPRGTCFSTFLRALVRVFARNRNRDVLKDHTFGEVSDDIDHAPS